MRIYTGYFAHTKNYEAAGLVPVSISRWSPKWYEGIKEPALAPPEELLRRYKSDNPPSDKEYEEAYIRQLSVLKVKDALYRIKDATGNRDVVLMCYEKPGDLCHRHMLSEYIKQHLRVWVEEFDVQKYKEQQQELAKEEEERE